MRGKRKSWKNRQMGKFGSILKMRKKFSLKQFTQSLRLDCPEMQPSISQQLIAIGFNDQLLE